jgi:ABC-type transporter Mla MlaB component
MAVHEKGIITFAIAAPIERSDLPGLFKRACGSLCGSGASVALCDVSGAGADAVTVDALAQLQLAARRYGCQMRLLHASQELRGLIAFVGLRDVLQD